MAYFQQAVVAVAVVVVAVAVAVVVVVVVVVHGVLIFSPLLLLRVVLMRI